MMLFLQQTTTSFGHQILPRPLLPPPHLILRGRSTSSKPAPLMSAVAPRLTGGASIAAINQKDRSFGAVFAEIRNSKLRLIDDFLRLGQELVAFDDGGDTYASARN